MTLLGKIFNAIHDDESAEISSIDEKLNPSINDLILIEDSEDGNNKKSILIGNLPTGGGDYSGFGEVFVNLFSGSETTDENNWKSLGASEIDTAKFGFDGYFEAVLSSSDDAGAAELRLVNITTNAQIGDILEVNGEVSFVSEQITLTGGVNIYEAQLRSPDGYYAVCKNARVSFYKDILNAPDASEDGYVAIAQSGDLTYIGGETDGYVLTWNAGLNSWEPQEPTGTAETPTLAEVLTESNSAGSQNIIDLLDPTNPQDAATKNYIDGYVETLGGDLSGSLPNPEVTDLTITSEEQGSVLYFDGANWVQLPPSTDGYVLTTHGIGTNPTWEENSATGELTGIQFINVFSGVETHDLDGWKTIGAVGITSTEATGTASLEAILYTSDGVSDGYARLYNTTTMEQIGSDLTTTDNLPTLLSSAITLTTGFNIYELQIKIEQDGTGEFVSCGMGRIKIIGESGLTPPESSEDGYVAIGYNGDLTYLSGIEDGYVLTWDAGLGSWTAAEPTGGPSGETWVSPDALDAYVNDWNPTGFSTATIVRVDAVDDGYSITGFDASATVVKKKVINVSAYDVVIANQDVGSVATNRIISQIGGLVLAADDAITIVYDPVTERWRVI
jgi:hypothetical protein